VAENPIRTGRLAANIVEMTTAILQALDRSSAESRQTQIDYALGLVTSGQVSRECGVQLALIDLLVEAGADPGGAMPPALAHREVEAVERLLERGAPLTFLTAICTGRLEEAARLAPGASAEERQAALSGAALYGRADALALVINLGVDVAAFNPLGFHAHCTPLHQAVGSGSLDAVRVLVEAGAPLDVKDRLFDGTPCRWAEYLWADRDRGLFTVRAGLTGREKKGGRRPPLHSLAIFLTLAISPTGGRVARAPSSFRINLDPGCG
jgi:peptide-methionine (S)-S-oxide reductase